MTPMIDGSGCLPQGAVGQFNRRSPNPRLIAGSHTFTDNEVDTAVADPDLLWDGTTWHLYYSSPHGTFAAPGATIVRHATSTDLVTWTMQDAPVVTGMQPSVAILSDLLRVAHFYMIYNDGAALAVATSTDGATFTPTGAKLTANEALSDPELAFVGGTFHVWFTATSSDVHGIGHATSTDLATWQFDPIPISSLQRGTQPTVIYDEEHCRWEMWLSNDQPTDTTGTISGATAGYWHATSTNATSWSISYQQLRDVVWTPTENGEHLGLRPGADVASKNGGRYMLYTGFDNGNVPTNSTLPTANGTTPGVMTLNLATRDTP